MSALGHKQTFAPQNRFNWSREDRTSDLRFRKTAYTSSAILKQAENAYFLLAFKSSSAAETPRLALRVKAVGCGFHSETSFSALSSSCLVRIPAISFTCFLGGTFESLKYAYAKAKSFGAPFP